MRRHTCAACPECVCGKSSHQPPVGLLHPLSVPQCPWSHIAVDFVTGLPGGHTEILTIVDHFSKATHFVPLSKLPTVAETRELLVKHSQRHCVQLNTVHLPGVAVLLRAFRRICEPLFWAPPPIPRNALIRVWRTCSGVSGREGYFPSIQADLCCCRNV